LPQKSVRFDGLDETEFEEFCFELLGELGFVNADWRKGTGLSTSPSDRGRDIVCQLERTDIDGTRHLETWFVECKNYTRGVPPEKLQNLLAWANAERPHTALFIVSNFLSNAAKDFLKSYVENNRPPFRVKYWERPILERLTEGKDTLLRRYLVQTETMRSESDVIAAQEEFFEKVWYHRHMLSVMRQREQGQEPPTFQLEAGARVRARIEKYPDYSWPMSDFELGMINGKLSALRWVLGEEWDFLDT